MEKSIQDASQNTTNFDPAIRRVAEQLMSCMQSIKDHVVGVEDVQPWDCVPPDVLSNSSSIPSFPGSGSIGSSALDSSIISDALEHTAPQAVDQLQTQATQAYKRSPQVVISSGYELSDLFTSPSSAPSLSCFVETDKDTEPVSSVDALPLEPDSTERVSKQAKVEDHGKICDFTEYLYREPLSWFSPNQSFNDSQVPLEDNNDGSVAISNWTFLRSSQLAEVPPDPDVVDDKSWNLRGGDGTSISFDTPQSASDPPPCDVRKITTHEELQNALWALFKFVHVDARTGLTPTHGWNIGRQVALMSISSGRKFHPGTVLSPQGKMTRSVDMDLVHRTFYGPDQLRIEERGHQFSDIANGSPYTFSHQSIKEVSLLSRIHESGPSTPSSGGVRASRNQGSHNCACSEDESMILTNGPSCTPWQYDRAGRCIAVVGIKGVQLWYGLSESLEANGSQVHVDGSNATNCWKFTLRVGPGDCVIQAPGESYSVLASEDVLVASRFFYTAATFSRSIKCVNTYLQGLADDSDSMSVPEWRQLEEIVRNMTLDDLFTDQESSDVLREVEKLLNQQDIIFKDEETEEMKIRQKWRSDSLSQTGQGNKRKRGNTKKNMEKSKETAKADFLRACLEWWWSNDSSDAQ